MKVAICPVQVGPAGAHIDSVQQLGASWVQFGDQVLLFAEDSQWVDVVRRSESSGLGLAEVSGVSSPQELYMVIQQDRLFQQENPKVRVPLDIDRYLVVQLAPVRVAAILERGQTCYTVRPLPPNTIVFNVRSRVGAARAAPLGWIRDLVNAWTGLISKPRSRTW